MGPGPLVFAVLSQGDKRPCFDQVSSVCGKFLCEGPPGILPAHTGSCLQGGGGLEVSKHHLFSIAPW